MLPKRYADTYLHNPDSVNPIVVSVKPIDRTSPTSREVSYGWMLATIATTPMNDTARALGYLMKEGLLPVRGDGYTLARIDELDERDGGMDILMNEVRKLPTDSVSPTCIRSSGG